MTSALSLLQASKRVLVAGHLRADGDSLGAAIVVARGLRALGKEAFLVMPDSPDGRYGFLYEETPWSLYTGAESLPEHDLVVVCDCSQLDRLGTMGEALRAQDRPRLVVDHHPFDRAEHTWTAEYHDVQAAATGLLAVALMRELGVEPDGPALEAAFVALMTDTGWLKYSNADAAAFSAAAELVGLGVDPDRVFRAIYQQTHAGTPAGIAAALAGTEYHFGNQVVLSSVSQEQLNAANAHLKDTDDVLDILRSVQSVEGVAFLSERGQRVKLSLRSKTWLDVNMVARQVGGGGHARAAGATFAEGVDLATARSMVLAAFEKALSER